MDKTQKILQLFDDWNLEKKDLNQKQGHPYINEREVWFIKLGKNVGTEQDGKTEFMRPVVVMKKIGNLFFCLPLTTGGKESKWYYSIKSIDFGNTEKGEKIISKVCLGHAKTMDPRRFRNVVGQISKVEFEILKNAVKELYL